MSARAVPPGGFTLLETLVAVAVLGFSVTVVGLTIGSALGRRQPPASWSAQLEAARERAVRSGSPVVVTPDSAHEREPVLFLPDGRAVGPDVDLLGGRLRRSP